MRKAPLLRLLSIVLLLALPLWVGWWAVELLRFQQLSGCQSLKDVDSQANDSVAMTFYCAQLSAGQQTVDSLTEAIRAARSVPHDHPLAAQSDRKVEQWSQNLLGLAEDSFQTGKLEDAIDTARRIPVTTSVYRQADEKIKVWQAVWDKAQLIDSDAQAFADREDWDQAFEKARALRSLSNRYWNSDRYQELVQKIQDAKEGKATFAKAEQERKKKAPSIAALPPDPLANWQQQQEREAGANLDRARKLAAAGTVDGLRAATDAAGQVLFGTRRYEEAQRLIDRWHDQMQEVEDRPYLNRAVQLASKGDTSSLQAAIAEASNVSFGSSLYQEAQDKIGQWTDRLQALNLQSYPERPIGAANGSPTNYTLPPAKVSVP